MYLGLKNAKTKTIAKFPRRTITRTFSNHLVWSCWCDKWCFLWVQYPALSTIIHRSYPGRMLKLLLRPFVNYVTHFSGTMVILWSLDTKGTMEVEGHFIRWWAHSTIWVGALICLSATTGDVWIFTSFQNLGSCAAYWARFVCLDQLWPTTVRHPYFSKSCSCRLLSIHLVPYFLYSYDWFVITIYDSISVQRISEGLDIT